MSEEIKNNEIKEESFEELLDKSFKTLNTGEKGCSGRVKYEYTFVEKLEAPVEKGQFVGEFLVTLDGSEVFRSDIVAREDVRRMSFGMYLLRILGEIIAF